MLEAQICQIQQFLPFSPKCEISGDGGGLTVFVNFNI